MPNEVVTFLVLGMHKSGTTLLSETLHRSGIPMVESCNPLSYDQGNKWERAATARINKQLIGTNGSLLSQGSHRLDNHHSQLPLYAEAADIARRENSSGRIWGFKDPRTLLVLPFWLDVLERCRFIAVFRDPRLILDHYLHRASDSERSDTNYQLCVLSTWCVYNLRLLQVIRQHKDIVVFNYEDIIKNQAELDRLAHFLGTPVIDVRKTALSRSNRIDAHLFTKRRLQLFLRSGYEPMFIYHRLCRHANIQKKRSTYRRRDQSDKLKAETQ